MMNTLNCCVCANRRNFSKGTHGNIPAEIMFLSEEIKKRRFMKFELDKDG